MAKSDNSLLTTVLLLSAILVANAQTDTGCIVLRSGQVCPRRPEGTTGGGTTTQGGTAVGSPTWKLQVVQYTEGVAVPLRNALVAQGARILDFVGRNALLVYALNDRVVRAAARYSASVADFTPEIKVSPETARVIDAAMPAQRRRDRRRALLAAAGDSADGSSSAGRALLDAAAADESAAATSPVLSNLMTWALHTGSRQGGDNANPRGDRPGASAPPPPAAGQQGPEQFMVSARLVPDLDRETLATVTRSWPVLLAKALGRSSLAGQQEDPCQPRLETGDLSLSTPLLYAAFCEEDVPDGTAWLSSRDIVVYLEPMINAGPNNAVGGWIAQTGTLNQTTYRSPAAALRPYWSANIQGQGVIVGVTDTGLDMGQCYFLDPRYRPGSFVSSFVGNPPRLSLPYHRKVVQYVLPETVGVNWFGSEDQGHGSHVVGTIAGAILNSTGGLVSDAATGSAPFARISFFGTSKPDQRGFYVPPPLDDKVLSYHYGAGARLSSDSWGRVSALGVAYMSDSRAFDAFAWRNPDFLSVLSAGNYGGNGMMSVVAPATAKNVLTLGASLSYPKNTTDGYFNQIFYFRYRDAKGVLQESVVWPKSGSSLDVWRGLLNAKDVTVRLPTPENACSPLSSSLLGAIALLDLADTTCTTDVAVANVVAAGAMAILYIASDEWRFAEEQKGSLPSDVPLPYALVSRVQGVAMRTAVRNVSNTAESLTCFSYTSTSNSSRANFGIESIAPSSSYGPLWDERLKPDLVAPGGPMLSAWGSTLNYDANRDTCSRDTVSFQGTSMSTALTSGHLALMRQYFRDGFYPAGTPNSPVAAAFEPSGMLLKAAVIAGARSMAGGTALASGAVLGAGPDGFQGWGRLDISGALPLPGLTNANFRVAMADYGTINNGDYIHLKGIKATGTGPVVAALVWHDYPSGGIGVKDLVNDLDFGYLINPKNNSLTFNQSRPDNSNNVERVELTTLKANDQVTFVVYGKSIKHQLLTGPDAQLPQRWSVFVAGHFTGTLKTPLNPFYARPQRLPSTRNTVWLNGTLCAFVNGTSLTVSSVCNTNSSIFTFVEETDNVTGALVYTVRDLQSRCWALRSNSTGAAISLATCNSSTAAGQKFAFFRNPYTTNGTVPFQIVPLFNLGSRAVQNGEDRRCVRTAGNALTLQPNCNEDDVWQNFRLERPASVPLSPPPPPGRPPPSPTPAASPAEPWYPYPLLFRTDWYPVGGQPNVYDYDYTGPEAPETALSNLDIVVSWTSGGSTYKVTIDNYLIFDNNMTSVAGAVHGGDNQFYGTMYEEVHFQVGYTPPAAQYNVCVIWRYAETPQMRVKLTVFRGNAVATMIRTFNTAIGITSDNCDPSAPGFVGSYNFTADPVGPPAPPSPPAPPIPLPSSYDYPLVFRADWTPVSGVTGRDKQLVDLDIVVTWADSSGSSYELGYDFQPAGAKYGGNNLDNRVNYEIVYWPSDAIPPAASFNVCVRWYDTKKPLPGWAGGDGDQDVGYDAGPGVSMRPVSERLHRQLHAALQPAATAAAVAAAVAAGAIACAAAGAAAAGASGWLFHAAVEFVQPAYKSAVDGRISHSGGLRLGPGCGMELRRQRLRHQPRRPHCGGRGAWRGQCGAAQQEERGGDLLAHQHHRPGASARHLPRVCAVVPGGLADRHHDRHLWRLHRPHRLASLGQQHLLQQALQPRLPRLHRVL